MQSFLIADNGATKCKWVLIHQGKKKECQTEGLSPYLMSSNQIATIIQQFVEAQIPDIKIDAVHFYGTGLFAPKNVEMMQSVLSQIFPDAILEINHDMMAVARATCGHAEGIACILGTGSNSCFYDGKEITKMRTGIGYILGDEGSGAYLGRKVLQYYLYKTFEDELLANFEHRFHTDHLEIIENVYRKPLANRYLASFAVFLAENRGHYMIENIIEDCLNDFIITHLYKYPEVWNFPVYFSGGVANAYRDVLEDLCVSYGIEVGGIYADPMEGLIQYHREKNQ